MVYNYVYCVLSGVCNSGIVVAVVYIIMNGFPENSGETRDGLTVGGCYGNRIYRFLGVICCWQGYLVHTSFIHV